MIFLSYPRTGVNFLCKAIEYKTKVRIDYNHETYTNENIVLNIVRDPKESITSWITMSNMNQERALKNNNIDNLVKTIAKNKYISMYKFLLSRDTIFINYKDLKEIDKLIDAISKKLDIPCSKIPIDKEEIDKLNEGQRYVGYHLTSKKSLKYNQYKKEIDQIDLSECYNLYYKALNRCIKI